MTVMWEDVAGVHGDGWYCLLTCAVASRGRGCPIPSVTCSYKIKKLGLCSEYSKYSSECPVEDPVCL